MFATATPPRGVSNVPAMTLRRLAAAVLILAATGCSSDTKIAPAPAAGPRVQTRLVFAGDVQATATGSVAVAPAIVAKGDGTDKGAPPWSTQCAFAGAPGAAWSAVVTVDTPGNRWQITIDDLNQTGNPTPGTHLAVTATERGTDTNLELDVRSQHPIAGFLTSGAGEDNGYRYYVPPGHNGGAATVGIDPDMRSGSLDAWLTPDALSNLSFHITGVWSCA